MLNKIALIGGGNIGGVLAQEIFQRKLARVVALVDVKGPDVAKGKCLDIAEATHGPDPKHAGKDAANPGSLILSGVMLLQYLGWRQAASLIEAAVAATIQQGRVTQDLARQMPGATELKTSEFADAIIGNM